LLITVKSRVILGDLMIVMMFPDAPEKETSGRCQVHFSAG
jgi:hypothetical protein